MQTHTATSTVVDLVHMLTKTGTQSIMHACFEARDCAHVLTFTCQLAISSSTHTYTKSTDAPMNAHAYASTHAIKLTDIHMHVYVCTNVCTFTSRHAIALTCAHMHTNTLGSIYMQIQAYAYAYTCTRMYWHPQSMCEHVLASSEHV